MTQQQRAGTRPATLTEIANLFGLTTNQVYMWHTRRRTNGFPEPVASVHQPERGARRKAPLFDLPAVIGWYTEYDPAAGRGAHWAAKRGGAPAPTRRPERDELARQRQRRAKRAEEQRRTA